MQKQIPFSMRPQLSNDEQVVWDILSSDARGRKNAITRASLASAASIPARRVNSVIKSLIEVHLFPVGSSPHHPAGIFVIETIDEMRDVVGREYRRALSTLHRVRTLRNISERDLAGQIEIDLRAYRSTAKGD